jgi:hypothetical protein
MLKAMSLLPAVVALTMSVTGNQASTINGSVNFAPTKTIKATPNLWANVPAVAVDFKAGPNAIINDSGALTGDFLAILPTPEITPYDVTFLDFTTGGAAVPNVWSIAGGPSFDLTSSVNLSTDNLFLTISGTGILHAPGYDDTEGTFTLQANRTSATGQVEFYFSASTTTTPDGGATAGLLGLGLLCVGTIARRKK